MRTETLTYFHESTALKAYLVKPSLLTQAVVLTVYHPVNSQRAWQTALMGLNT